MSQQQLLSWEVYPHLHPEMMTDQLLESEIATSRKEKLEAVVTEKIHGANFAIWKDGTGTFRYFSRNQEITSFDKKGFGKYITTSGIKDDLERKLASAPECIIYGELYGHYFPEDGIETESIQCSMTYSPTYEFRAFDVKMSIADNEVVIFLPFYEALQFALDYEIAFVPILFHGTVAEVLTYVVTNVNEYRTSCYRGDQNSAMIAEGFVWRYCDRHDLFKYRSISYRETHGIKKRVMKKRSGADAEDYSEYFCENRIASVFSHESIWESLTELAEALFVDVKDAVVLDGGNEKEFMKNFKRYKALSFKYAKMKFVKAAEPTQAVAITPAIDTVVAEPDELSSADC